MNPGGKQDTAHEPGSGNIDFFNLLTRDSTSSSSVALTKIKVKNIPHYSRLSITFFQALHRGILRNLENMPSTSTDREKRKTNHDNQNALRSDNPSGQSHILTSPSSQEHGELVTGNLLRRSGGDSTSSSGSESGSGINKDQSQNFILTTQECLSHISSSSVGDLERLGNTPSSTAYYELPSFSESLDQATRKIHNKNQHVSKSDNLSGQKMKSNPPAKRLGGDSWPSIS
ncbi:hypothetical protein PSTT_13433 [Puccinia striiformis]|uniref:Uncharacterized protein n=1 Tax=Puccinia striiformis TaxID=27350 RepID=A0A2S4URP6_9BASI|nr:hypothetical protein PSTT_13433 [Puccinia striiformis]